MTVKAIRLKNFMAFKDTGWIELRPITLLFGKNSSGKSSIIRALRLLKQSLDQCKQDEPLAFAVEDGANLGSFQDMIHQHELENVVTFGFRCDFVDTALNLNIRKDTGIDAFFKYVNYKLFERDLPEIPLESFDTELDILMSFAWDVQHTPQPIVVPVSIQIEAPWEILQNRELCLVCQLEREREVVEEEIRDEHGNIIQDESWRWLDNWFPWSDFIDEDNENKDGIDELLFSSAFMKLEKGFLPCLETTGNYSKQASNEILFFVVEKLLADFREQIDFFLRNINYLPPIRPKPARSYSLNRFERHSWEKRGFKTFLDFLSGDINQEQMTKIGDWLGKMEQYKIVDVDRYYSGPMGLMAKIEVKRDVESQPDSILDVGYGVSQILPVIIQGVLAEPGQFIIIEQPELHLHPKIISVMADFLIQMLERDAFYLIETHSEHLLLRFQRRIAETRHQELTKISGTLHNKVNDGFNLKSSDFSLIFTARYEGASKIKTINIHPNGELSNPPAKFKNFFAQDYDDVMGMSSAVSKIIDMENQS